MGIGQAITMPLFFASNALYPVAVMPEWLRWLSAVNPLSYEVNALRGLLIGSPTNAVPRYHSACRGGGTVQENSARRPSLAGARPRGA